MNKHRASVLMRHEVGLHARPSVKLTKLAKAFQSRIDLGLSPDGPWVDAKSIVKVMATKAPKDTTIYFRAEGTDAKAALGRAGDVGRRRFSGWTIERIELLIASKGGPPPPELRWDRSCAWLPRSMTPVNPAPRRRSIRPLSTPSRPPRQISSRSRTKQETRKRKQFSLSRPLSSKTITLRRRRLHRSPVAKRQIRRGVLRSISEITSYEGASDPYFRARASDLRDLRDRVLRHLTGEADQTLPAGVIVAADDMPPSIFLATDWHDGGLVLRRGSPSSHVAILARSRGVPMIVGVDVDHLEDGTDALLDGDAGLLVVNPDGDMRTSYCQRRAEQSDARQAAASFSGPALTATGELVRVMINVTGLAELADLDPAHVDGIGLMRTEFLFQGREKLPTEEEQYQIYKRMLEWAAGRPVTIRTLDAGGDKPIAGLTHPGDINPFLGVRGVRLSLRHLDVFRAQLRALARAAVAGNLKVMIPMVTVPEELDRCRALLEQSVEDLRREGQEAQMPRSA